MSSRLALTFNKMPDIDLNTLLLVILESMTNNPNFAHPQPMLSKLNQLSKEYINALSEAHYGDILKIAIKNDIRKNIIPLLKKLGEYVETEAKGERSALISSGFPLYRDNPIQDLQSPTGFRISPGPKNGEIIVQVDRVFGAKSYLYQYTKDPLTKDSVWEMEVGTRCRASLNDLPLGVKYWFRIAAIGARKQIVYTEALARYIA